MLLEVFDLEGIDFASGPEDQSGRAQGDSVNLGILLVDPVLRWIDDAPVDLSPAHIGFEALPSGKRPIIHPFVEIAQEDGRLGQFFHVVTFEVDQLTIFMLHSIELGL